MNGHFLQTSVGPRNGKCNFKINLNAPAPRVTFLNASVIPRFRNQLRDRAGPGERKLTSMGYFFSVSGLPLVIGVNL